MEEQELIEAKRARNFIWTAAEKYEFEPMFLAFSPDPAVVTEKSGRNKKICRGMFWEEYLFARIPGKNRTKIVCGKS